MLRIAIAVKQIAGVLVFVLVFVFSYVSRILTMLRMAHAVK